MALSTDTTTRETQKEAVMNAVLLIKSDPSQVIREVFPQEKVVIGIIGDSLFSPLLIKNIKDHYIHKLFSNYFDSLDLYNVLNKLDAYLRTTIFYAQESEVSEAKEIIRSLVLLKETLYQNAEELREKNNLHKKSAREEVPDLNIYTRTYSETIEQQEAILREFYSCFVGSGYNFLIPSYSLLNRITSNLQEIGILTPTLFSRPMPTTRRNAKVRELKTPSGSFFTKWNELKEPLSRKIVENPFRELHNEEMLFYGLEHELLTQRTRAIKKLLEEIEAVLPHPDLKLLNKKSESELKEIIKKMNPIGDKIKDIFGISEITALSLPPHPTLIDSPHYKKFFIPINEGMDALLSATVFKLKYISEEAKHNLVARIYSKVMELNTKDTAKKLKKRFQSKAPKVENKKS